MSCTTFLIIWFSFYFLALWTWAKEFNEITLGVAILALTASPLCFLIWQLCYSNGIVLWKRKYK